MHRPYRDLQNLKFSCLYLFPFSHKVVYQKASGRGSEGGLGRGRVAYHTSTVLVNLYLGGIIFVENILILRHGLNSKIRHLQNSIFDLR